MFSKKNKNKPPSKQEIDPLPRLGAAREYFVKSVDYVSSITYHSKELEIGAILLIDPITKKDVVRFSWKYAGANDTITPDNAFSISDNMEKLLADFPGEQPFKFQVDCFGDDRSRQAELLSILAHAPLQTQKILIEEIAEEQKRHAKGVTRPRNITIWSDYTPPDRFEQDEGMDRKVTQLTQFANRILSKVSKTAEAIDRHQRDLLLLDAYQHFIQINALLASRLGALDITPLKPNEPWQMCRAELNRFGDRLLSSEELDKLQIAPQTITVDLERNEISEDVTTLDHPAEELIRFSQSKPDIIRDHVRVDGKYVGCFLLTSTPRSIQGNARYTTSELQFKLLGDLCNQPYMKDFKIVFMAERVDQVESKSSSHKNIRQLASGVKWKHEIAGVSVAEEDQLQDAKDAERQLSRNSPKIRFGFAIYLYRNSYRELTEAARYLTAYFSSPAKLIWEDDNCDELFFAGTPFSARKIGTDCKPFIKRDQRLDFPSREASTFLPVLKTRSLSDKGIQLISESGQPIYIDLFSDPRHMALWGMHRSGKSLYIAWQTFMAHAMGIPAMLLDYTPSAEASTFKAIIKALGGAYVNILNSSLNPLQTPNLSKDLDPETRNDLIANDRRSSASLLSLMCLGSKGTNHPRPSRIRFLINMILESFWNDFRIQRRHESARRGGLGSPEWDEYPIISDVINFCDAAHCPSLTNPTAEDRDDLGFIRLALTGIVEDKALGTILNKPSSFDLNSPIMCMAMRSELDDDSMAILGSLMFQTCYMRATEINSDSLLVCDEMNRLTSYPSLSLLIGEVATNAAKAGIHLLIAGQNPAPVFASAGGGMIKSNMDIKLVFRIDSAAVQDFSDALGIPTQHLRKNVGNSFLPNRQERSSRCWVQSGDMGTHATIYLPPSLVTLTSNNVGEIANAKTVDLSISSLTNQTKELTYAEK
jgi:hypothetical protein